MDCRSPSITRLQLAHPSLLLPTGGLYLALNNSSKNPNMWVQPESKFEQALNLYWKTARSSHANAAFGVDALVLPYLAHFCAIAKMFTQSASCDLLSQINSAFKWHDLDRGSLMLNLCADLLESIEEERNAEHEQVARITTNLEVKHKLICCLQRMKDEFASKRMLLQVEGPLEEWRLASMALFAHAASIDDFSDKCQRAFERYIQGATASLMDADYRLDLEFVDTIEKAPALRLNAARSISFRCEVVTMSSLYADTHLGGDKSALPYTAYTPLQYAVENYVLRQSLMPSLSGRYPEDPMKVALWKQNLMDCFNFDYFSAEQLLKQVHRFG